jgi:hypothetical protein
MRTAIALSLILLTGCQAVPRTQAPVLTTATGKPMIIVRHNGGVQDGACPMWVKIDGVHKGELQNGNSLALDVEKGVRTVSMGRSAGGVYGAGTICSGSLQTKALVTRDFEVGDAPVRVAYEMQGTGKRWIPIAGFFLAPTPALVLDKSSE